MTEDTSAAQALTRDTEKILATRPGLAALRTSDCPSIVRCIEVFTNPRTGWTPAEVRHFRSCPYCFEVGLAMSRASRSLPRIEEPPSFVRRLAAAAKRILTARWTASPG